MSRIAYCYDDPANGSGDAEDQIMISNHPCMVGQQELQARHSDMLAAARRGEVVDPNRMVMTVIEMPPVALGDIMRDLASPPQPKWRIRVPHDYIVTDGPPNDPDWIC